MKNNYLLNKLQVNVGAAGHLYTADSTPENAPPAGIVEVSVDSREFKYLNGNGLREARAGNTMDSILKNPINWSIGKVDDYIDFITVNTF